MSAVFAFLSGSLAALVFAYARIRSFRRRVGLELGARIAYTARSSFAEGVQEGFNGSLRAIARDQVNQYRARARQRVH